MSVYDFQKIQEQVKWEQEKKYDISMNLNSATPFVEGSATRLKMGRKVFETTPTGLSSLLSRVAIPYGFYNRCSGGLKKEILDEHYVKRSNQDVRLRAYKDTGFETLRYVGSELYSPFDDYSIMDVLSEVSEMGDYKIREFQQSLDFFVMRLTTPEPISYSVRNRPIYAGVQISNSETGRSSVRISFLLWEEVCTNGMTVVREEWGRFVQRHIGKKGTESLKYAAEDYLRRLPDFKASMDEKYNDASKITGEQAIEKFRSDKRIPKKIKKEMTETYLSNYAPSIEDATAVDVLSAYTEAIQTYQWDSRFELEDIAGDYLLEFSGN